MQHRIFRLFCLFFVVLILLLTNPSAIARAKTLEFRWLGENGYAVQGSLIYPEEREPMKPYQQNERKKTVESLTVSIYDPSGNKIKTYENIKHYISQNPYLQLNFDAKKEKIDGLIDLGGDSAGEMFLKGIVDTHLSLVKIDSSGQEKIYDHNLGQIEQVKF